MSDPITLGIPNRGKISSRIFLTTTLAVSFLFGIPKVIGSDNGPAFVAQVSQGLAIQLGIDWKLHCAYRPQSWWDIRCIFSINLFPSFCGNIILPLLAARWPCEFFAVNPKLSVSFISSGVEAIHLPAKVAIIHCPGHQKGHDAVTRGNNMADVKAKQAALKTKRYLLPYLVDFTSVKSTSQ